MSDRHHFLILTHPVHSHTNPALQLATRLLRLGAKVTFATSASACTRITSNGKYKDIHFVHFPDNFIYGFDSVDEHEDPVKLAIKQSCSATLAKVVSTSSENGWPITCSVFTPTVPWIMGVAQELPAPCVLLWTQPATVLVLFHYFFFGYGDAMTRLFGCKDSIELPGLPFLLEGRDLPTFMRPVNPHPGGIKVFELQTKWIAAKENCTNILVNTVEELEPDALKAVKELNMVPIGPLIPLDMDDVEGRSDADYIKWLDSKAEASVVYVSFGSIWDPTSGQVEEVARALLDVGRPFLWIIRTPGKQNEEAEEEKKKKKNDVPQIMGCMKELEQLGLIVPWCVQQEVLSHKSIGCFVTHCGWNSTLESLASGVPMVGVPLWVEQVTNAKMVEEYWKCGVRACTNVDDLVERDELRRCVELVMGDEGMRERAGKWKKLAVGAAVENGPADENLSHFIAGLKHA